MNKIFSVTCKKIIPFARSFCLQQKSLYKPLIVQPVLKYSKYQFSTNGNSEQINSNKKGEYNKNFDKRKEERKDSNKEEKSDKKDEKDSDKSSEDKNCKEGKNQKEKVNPKEERIEKEKENKVNEGESTKKVSEIDELKTLVEKLQKEANEWKQEKLYMIAENDNQIKRITQEIEKSKKAVQGRFGKDFLFIYDNLHNLLKFNIQDKDKLMMMDKEKLINECYLELIQICKFTHDSFLSALKKYSIITFDCLNKKCDSNFHEPVEIIETNKPEEDGIILEVTQEGFMHEKVLLRASHVKVGKMKKEEKK